jgi:AraC-like DNA-binding protein
MTQEMLEFCATHQVPSDIELIPMQKINEAWGRLLRQDVRYRFVIDMASLKSCLRQSTVELNEAAYLLGYEDANSFFRAFHLWEGTSPGEWRTRYRAAEVEAVRH